MELALTRISLGDTCTIGELHADGEWICFTLEDKVREVEGQPVEKWKVAGETAIARGRYRVTLTMSDRFKRIMPLLLGVLGFVGIRIHWGNTDKDTEGCLLVGLTTAGNLIYKSRAAFDKLFPLIQAAIARGEEVWITIK